MRGLKTCSLATNRWESTEFPLVVLPLQSMYGSRRTPQTGAQILGVDEARRPLVPPVLASVQGLMGWVVPPSVSGGGTIPYSHLWVRIKLDFNTEELGCLCPPLEGQTSEVRLEKVIVGGRSAGLRTHPEIRQSVNWAGMAGIEVNCVFARENDASRRVVRLRWTPNMHKFKGSSFLSSALLSLLH